jgi:hypothetical protein
MALTCTRCGGFGEDLGCPECGKKTDELYFSDVAEERKFISLSENIVIPAEFNFMTWNKDMLISSKSFLDCDTGFLNYANGLDKLHQMFVDGKLSAKSCIIVSPVNFSKTIFGYSCMQFGLRHKLSVAPMLDTLEVRRLMMLCAVNEKYRLYNRIDYDRYMTSVVCFIKVTYTEEKNFSSATIRELMDRRARIGLPTYVLSECPVEQLSSKYDVNMLSVMNVEETSARRPVLIQYFGG